MRRKVLGIDLGGCMSGNSAYAVIEWEREKAQIVSLFKEPKHKTSIECAKYLQKTLNDHKVDAICVDAPFSLPKPLLSPNTITTPRDTTGEISNPYLFRYTDYWIFKEYTLRPMPPAGDRIGRLTARMVELLHQLKYQAPYIELGQQKVPIYEVYPKQIALALGFVQYKKTPTSVLEHFHIGQEVDEHQLDAILASYCGAEILNGNTIQPPKEAEDEGWCYPLIIQ